MNSIDRAQIAKEANDKLKQAEEKLDAELQDADTSAVFGSYAMFRLARSHAGEDSGTRPTPAAIELAAWLLFPHFGKQGSNEAAKIQSAIDALEEYQTAYTFAEMFAELEEDLDELKQQLRLYAGIVRGSAYPIQLVNRIKGAFGPLEQEYITSLGLGPLRALDIALAVLGQTEDNIHAMRLEFLRLSEEAEALTKSMTSQSEASLEELDRVTQQLQDNISGMSGKWIPTWDQTKAKLQNPSDEEWKQFRDLFGLSPETIRSVDNIVDLQDRPVYFTASDRAFSLQGTTLFDAIFNYFDDFARSDASLRDQYAMLVSTWMEQAIAIQMGRLFPAGRIIRSACFPDPDNEGGETEADVVVHWGPFLLVLEAKAKRVPKDAIRGGSKSLKPTIRKNIQDAFVQATRVIRILERDGCVNFREKTSDRTFSVSAKNLRRVMPISVTLQHLSDIATQLAVTQRLGLFKGNAYPWSVSLDDLDVITRFSGSPDVFLYYIERRTAHQTMDIRLNADELNLFGHFLDSRLHPLQYEGHKDISSHPGPKMISIDGGEERFEPFYTAEFLGEPPPGDPVVLQVPENIKLFLEELRRRSDDSARWIAFALLGLAPDALFHLDQILESFRGCGGPDRDLLRQTFKDGDLVFNVLVHNSLDEEAFLKAVTLRSRMEHYRARPKATISFGIDLRSSRPFEIAQWLEGEWEEEPELERLLEQDRQQQKVFRLKPGMKKPGRNDPCPCGSGEKFKKCCMARTTFDKS